MATISLPDGRGVRIVEHPSGNRTALIAGDRVEPPAPRPRRGEVQWYIAYTKVHPLTVEAAPVDAIWVDVSSSLHAYYGALADIWARGETFAILEHDVVCRPDVIQAFEECPEPWCLYAYDDICHPECRSGWRNALGCTRFRKEIIEAVPDALTGIDDPHYWDWHHTCDGIGMKLRAAGFEHHFHDPPVGHHRGVQSPQHEADYREKRGLVVA